MGIKIVGVGKALPEKHLTNTEIAKFVDTSDEWIKTRTGIEKRYISTYETIDYLAAAAANEALEKAKLSPEDIDLIIVATVSPSTSMPSTACLVASHIKAYHAICFDITAACSGFIYATEVAVSMMQQSHYKNALIIGAEVLSTRLDWNDRGTCVIFGDGAGAVIYQKSHEENQILQIETGTDAKGAKYIRLPLHIEDGKFFKGEMDKAFISMDGRRVYAFSQTCVPKSIESVVEKAHLHVEEIDHFILHQANSRIIDSVAQKLNVPIERFFKNIKENGNTSAASIPIAFYDAKAQFKKGDKIILSGFGAGLTWGTMLIHW